MGDQNCNGFRIHRYSRLPSLYSNVERDQLRLASSIPVRTTVWIGGYSGALRIAMKGTVLGVARMRGSFHRAQSFRNTDPEQLVWRIESSARSLGVKSEQLLTQGKVFEDEILAATKGTAKPAEKVPEPHDHGKNLI